MVEYDRTQEREYAQQARARICVAGIGGAGLNVLDRISLDRIMEATLVGLHTDVRVLSHAMAGTKIQLGAELMRGIGSGGDPELGREAAQLSRQQIKDAVQGHEMVFICCGLGGGTGSGAAPIVAEVAKECGAMVIVFATMPFAFEGRRRLRQGEIALEELQQTSDALVLFENNRMGELILPKEGIQKAFSQADQLMGQSVRAIASMVTQPGLVRVGIADLMTALRSPNARCLFGFGESRGTNRVGEALKRALKSPLVNQGQLLQRARNLLVHVTGGESLALAEVEALMKQLGKHVPESTQILFGLSVDQKLGDSLAITLLSSLSAQEMALENVADEAERIVVRETRKPTMFNTVLPPATDLPQTSESNGVRKTAVVPAPELKPRIIAEPVAKLVPPVMAPVAPAKIIPPVEDLFSAAAEPALKAQPVALKTDFILDESPEEHEEPVAVQPEPEPVAVVTDPVAPMTEIEPEASAADSVVAQPAEAAPTTTAPVLKTQPVKSAPEIDKPQPAQAAIPAKVVAQKTPEKTQPGRHSLLSAILRPDIEVPATPAALTQTSVFEVLDDEEESAVEEDEPGLQNESAPVAHDASPQIQAAVAHHELVQRAPKENEVVSKPASPQPPARRQQATVLSSEEYEQSSLKLSQEEIARFKGTEKTIVGGEDLDVPTWMRMRQKVRR